MYNLLKSEFYKLKYSKELLICIIGLLLMAVIGIYYGDICGRESVISQSRAMFGLMTCTLFAITNVGKDLYSKTINHALTSGSSRSQVFMSKYIAYLVACILILIVNYIFMGGLNTVFYGWGAVINLNEIYFIIVYMMVGMFFDLCIVSIPFFICMLVKTSSLAMALSGGTIGIILALTQLPWDTVAYTIASKDSSLGSTPVVFVAGFIIVTALVYLLCGSYFTKQDIQ